MTVELWNEDRNIPLPTIRFKIISPGTDSIKKLAIKNMSTKLARDVKLGAISTSSYRGGGKMLFENGWIFGRKFGNVNWITLTEDYMNDAIRLGDMLPNELIYTEIRISLPAPTIIKPETKCQGDPIKVFDINLPPEFIIKLMLSQL